MVQTIDLGNSEVVHFNDKDVEILQLNGTTIWEKLNNIAPYLNYTGLDSNGKMEGQLEFDGNIVAYAIGSPTITISTAEDGTQNESITYPNCNGYNSEYYGGYNFQNGFYSYLEETQIVDTTLELPAKYNGKPVIKILKNAFATEDGNSNDNKFYQACYVRYIILGDNIQEIDTYAFYYCRAYNVQFNNSLITINHQAFYPMQRINTELILPSSLKYVGLTAFKPSNTDEDNRIIQVNSNITSLPSNFGGDGMFDNIRRINYSANVTSVTGKILYNATNTEEIYFYQEEDTNVDINVDSLKSAADISIYTNNKSVKNYDWSSKNYTVTFYPIN
ncbi:MAG: leucine-rich repeat protein [Christensenellales bacterium]